MEKEVIRICRLWNAENHFLKFETSGSTGKKKEIALSRGILEYSARTTMSTLDPQGEFKSSLVCINPQFIGGTMALIRALVGKHNISFITPSSNPLTQCDDEYFDLVSMVPLQVQTILESNPSLFRKVGTVIIGGAPLADKYVEMLKSIASTRFYHSYGMTETASHFAVKDLKADDFFSVLGDAEIALSLSGTLKVRGTVTNDQWVETTDLVAIKDERKFLWIGRSDHIINTGGVKINPVEVENVLQGQIDVPFIVAGIPDEKLGQKLILVLESPTLSDDINLDFSMLSKYQVPKEIVHLASFDYTETGKINRIETVKKLIK